MRKLSLVALAAVLFFACGGNKKTSLVVGDWKIADMAVPMPPVMPDSIKGQYEEALKKQVEGMRATSTFNYKADGTYNYNLGGQIGAGTWAINDANTELTLTEGGKSDVNKVVTLTENKLVIETPQANGAGNLTLTLAK
ncbi:MAG TPA: lipocalin family protein [Bacteroidia bacterium]